MARIAPDLLDVRRYPLRHDVATRFADVDPNWHINNVAMAAAFEDARARFNRANDMRGIGGDLRSMIVSAHYEYLAQAHYPQPIAIFGAVAEIGRTSWTMAQVAVQDGVPCGYCRTIIVMVGDGGPSPLNADMRTLLAGAMLRDAAAGG